jgi:hypothetical protein
MNEGIKNENRLYLVCVFFFLNLGGISVLNLVQRNSDSTDRVIGAFSCHVREKCNEIARSGIPDGSCIDQYVPVV